MSLLMLCHVILTLLQLLTQLILAYELRFVRLRQLIIVTHSNSSRKWEVFVSTVSYSIIVCYATHEVVVESVW